MRIVIDVRAEGDDLIREQLDGATEAVARLATAALRSDGQDDRCVIEIGRLRGRVTELETQNHALREQIARDSARTIRLNAGLQDDLIQREAALGRALALARKLSVGQPLWKALDGMGFEYGPIQTEDPEWPEVVRWVASADKGEPTDGERLERAYRALRTLYNWSLEDQPPGSGPSHMVRQAAYRAVTQAGCWLDLREWDARTNPGGGDEDGQRQAGAASEPTPEDEARPDSADREAAAGAVCPGCGVEPNAYHALGCPNRPEPYEFRPGNGWTH
jgi:hypothetical protein